MQAQVAAEAADNNNNSKVSAGSEPSSGRFEHLMDQYADVAKSFVHFTLERVVRASFDEFMDERRGRDIVRITDQRVVVDYRNGTRLIKQLVVDSMALIGFQVPRNRAGGFGHPLLKGRGGRYAGRLAELAKEMFVGGVSTRRTRRAFEQAGMRIAGVSKTTMSRVTDDLRKEAIAWNNRKISDKFLYLQADAIFVKARKNSPHSLGTLVVIGITNQGKKRPLYFTTGAESRANYSEIFQMLIHRGLDTKSIRLVTVDGALGLIGAARECFGEDLIQRCTVHKVRNVIEKTPRNLREELKGKLNRLWNMPSIEQARSFANQLKAEYGEVAPKAIQTLFDDKDDLLRFYECPAEHRKSIRSTNLIERVNREIRRRTKSMDILESESTAWKVVMGVIREVELRWERKSHWRKSA